VGLAPDGAELWIPALLIGVGIVGVVVPVIPGLLLALVGVLLWSLNQGSTTGWVVLAVCVALYLGGMTLQFLVPGRRMRRQGVGTTALLFAVVLGVVGFFVVPVVGGPLGFVLGIYLVEYSRSRDRQQAWSGTRAALTAVLTSMGIELVAGLLIATTWFVGVLLTR